MTKLGLVHGAISAMVASFGAQLAAQSAVASDLNAKAARQRSVKPSMIAGVFWVTYDNGSYRSPEGIQRMKDRRIAYKSRSRAISKLSNTQKRKLGIKV